MALAKTGGKASTKPTHFWLSHPFQKSRVLRSWNPLISARSNHHCLSWKIMSFFFKLSLFKSPEFSIQFSQRCFIHFSLVFHPHIHSFRMVKSRAGESLLSFQTLGKGSHHDLQRPGYAWLPRGLNIFGETYVGKKLSNSQVTWWYEWDIDTCYKLYDFFGRLYSIFKDSTLPIGLYVYIYIYISGWWLTYPLKNMLVSWDDSSQ